MYDQLFGDRDPVKEPGTSTGTPGNWWTIFALVPEVFNHAVAGFAIYNRDGSLVDPKLRELGILRAGFGGASKFVYSQHCKAARAVGLSENQIRDVPSWTTSEHYSPLERAVLSYSDALVLSGGRVSDGTFSALQAELSDETILELTYVICTYALHATMSRALRLEYDDIDEPIEEVPAP